VEKMWITVEKMLIFGDIALGISKSPLESFSTTSVFPQVTPQVFIAFIKENVFTVRQFICNYKKVISLTHLSTTVITTNFKNKSFFQKVPVLGAAI